MENNILGMVADTESSDSLPGSSNAASETPANGLASKSIHQKSQETSPKKTHKAEREKLKRDQLNDLFVELGSMLDLDRQNTRKATVLGDAARVLRDLITQVESLRKEQSALVSERQYVSSEKNELQEENNSLKSQISELQNELCARLRNSSLNQNSLGVPLPVANTVGPDLATHRMPQQMWSNIPNLSSVAMAHPTNTATLLHSQGHSADAGQGYAPQPRELQLFPGASSPPEHGCSVLGNNLATSSSLTDSLPGQLCLSLPQSSQEGSSSGVSPGRKERRNG
ncbi:transcription factor BHLH062-like isoform X3 [Miscanthus floridulus]|uniref:transcription factor BHLH062-like isoform X3 n=1 Tax=Miscanthus floridulus TaxID=154761 RepID=UPI00345748D1